MKAKTEVSEPIIINAKSKTTTRSWNPFVGCNFDCTYCAPSFKKLLAWLGRMHKCVPCQNYAPHEHKERLTRIPSNKAIFVCEDGDIAFAKPKFMAKVFTAMRNDKREHIWFVQSKSPHCLKQYLSQLPENTYLATTIETNRDDLTKKISKAPVVSKRAKDFVNLQWDKKIVNIEPIMDFDLTALVKMIVGIKPKAVFIGYNTKPKAVPLPEPSKEKTPKLVTKLKRRGLTVFKRWEGKNYVDFCES
jgi:DNA repair photolyase